MDDDSDENEEDDDLQEDEYREDIRAKFPLGTIALYGPDDKRTTKIVAAVIIRKGAEPVMKRWMGSGSQKIPRCSER